MSTVVKDLGAVSAYAYAVEKGYTGTEAEFAELMAGYAEVGQRAEDAAESALNSKTDAQTAATTATNKASEATTAAQTASTKASEASQSASQALSYKTGAESAKTASQTAQGLAESARDGAITAKTAAETAQGKAEAAQAAAESVAESIPSDYSQLSEDVSDLKEDLTQKANTDGYYADLVSGGSTQLLSDMVATDTTPYNYRTAGGSLEIGDRMKLKKIVGGSLAVNQLVLNGNFSEMTGWSGVNTTFTISENVATITINDPGAHARYLRNTCGGVYSVVGHKYLSCFNAVGVSGTAKVTSRFGATNNATVLLDNTWKQFSDIFNATGSYAEWNVYISSGSDSDAVLRVKNCVCFDLTVMFGTTIADYVYGLETATAGAGVAWLKAHFPKIFDAGYIPYNAGTLEHVSGLSAHKMVGFNQWDEEWEVGSIGNSGENIVYNNVRTKNYNNALPSTTYYIKSPSSLMLFWYDVDKVFISSVSGVTNTTVTSPSNAAFFRFRTADNYGTTYNHDICINLSDPAKNGTYEPYKAHSYPLDSDVTLRGIPKLDANNSLYYDGDEYEADGTVTRRYGIVDLGSANWYYMETGSSFAPYFYTYVAPWGIKYEGSYGSVAYNFRCPNYTTAYRNISVFVDKTMCADGEAGRVTQIQIRDSSYTDAAAFKTAMSGVMLVYELATPTTESADPYIEIQNVSNWGTEEFVTTSLVPVGHETAYQPDLRAKIEVAPESPDTDGLYLMKRENGQNSYVAYIGELPSDPTTDGTYTLKCTVSGGTVTKTWEADE